MGQRNIILECNPDYIVHKENEIVESMELFISVFELIEIHYVTGLYDNIAMNMTFLKTSSARVPKNLLAFAC